MFSLESELPEELTSKCLKGSLSSLLHSCNINAETSMFNCSAYLHNGEIDSGTVYT